MNDKILSAMASDMRISKYESESDAQYCIRILYSAVACWIKTAAADMPLRCEVNSGVSRRHIVDRCAPVLNELLLRYPQAKQWFVPDSDTDVDTAVKQIRTRLIRHGDLLNVGFNTNLILSSKDKFSLSDSITVHKGMLLDPVINYQGIATLCTLAEHSMPHSEIIDTITWFKEYIGNVRWEKCNDFDQNSEFFNASQFVKNNLSCWQSKTPKSVMNIVLARRTVNNNQHEYYLIKLKNGDRFVHTIDPFFCDVTEHRRFFFALRTISNNKIPCRITAYSDHVFLQMWVHLPQKELTLLESYAWPHQNISDVLSWDMDIGVWAAIRPFLEALGFKIMES